MTAAPRRSFRVLRMYTDDNGVTAFDDLRVPGPPVSLHGEPASNALQRVPATTMNIVEMLEWRPRLDLHPPPRRQWVVVLQGAMEVSSDSGDRRRLYPGDCMLAEDLLGSGHRTDDVGEDRLVTLNVGIPKSWSWPVV